MLATLLSAPAHADDNRPLTITVELAPDGLAADVTWKIPANVAAGFMPDLLPPGGCVAEGHLRSWSDAVGTWHQQQWVCQQPLKGQAIAIAYPSANPGLATIARLHEPGQAVQTILLQPGDTVLQIPAAQQGEARASTFAEFLKLGFEHIWLGIDHLLFVTGLIIIAGTWRRILVTVTGFTLAHSVTLGLAALDLISLPIRAVEAVIALSIVFLAVEIVKGPRDSLTWRRPVAVASTFGLLHGFGFASVLREVGLPDQGLLTALFAFNIGIEIGQVIFAGLLFALLRLVTRLRPAQGEMAGLQRMAGYTLGIVASYWLVERLIGA
ncbi:hypothetical protein GRI32_01030 [Altererythrobacter aestuarii]|uniref:HupE/UreJ family protein n=2 Tax=Alteraurantiacibacter aestuarii TaxID=650004 RepID=A0A844ZJW0_9SPHN|nr:hypothetical protein [Alteraurantiacibacter aestuarii]